MIFFYWFFKEPFPSSPLHYLEHFQQSYPIQMQKQQHIQKFEPKRANYTTKYFVSFKQSFNTPTEPVY